MAKEECMITEDSKTRTMSTTVSLSSNFTSSILCKNYK